MTEKVFVDTHVLVYSRDTFEPAKQILNAGHLPKNIDHLIRFRWNQLRPWVLQTFG